MTLSTPATRSLVSAAAALTVACASAATRPPAVGVRAVAALRLGHPPAASLMNANGSPRISSAASYERMLQRVAPVLEAARSDPRLALDPNYLAALLTKESGGDTLAVSAAPAIGVAQLTAVADAELQRLTGAPRAAWPAFSWMSAEVNAWPRDARLHRAGVAAAVADSLIRGGALDSRAEYLLDPVLSARAASFYVRLLEARWSEDSLPGSYAAEARQRIGGRALSAGEVLALVTVSYNQGPEWVLSRLQRDGAEWSLRLNDGSGAGMEATDYLERVQSYATIFRDAARMQTPPP